MLAKLWRLFKFRLGQLRQRGVWLTFLNFLDRFARFFTGRSAARFSRVEPQIILGGQPARWALSRLVANGVTGVVNMRGEYDYLGAVGSLKLNYLHLPTVDNTPPSLEDLRKGVEFIQQNIANGGSVYIHCWAGLGRGPTMAAAYLVSTGMSPEAAWSKIRKVRPFVQPLPEQIKQLEQFAQQYSTTAPLEQAVSPPPVQPLEAVPSEADQVQVNPPSEAQPRK